MNIFEMIFSLALFLAIAWIVVPLFFSIAVMLLPFIGVAIVIVAVIAIMAK